MSDLKINKRTSNNGNLSIQDGDTAIVVGGSIAGLLAAQVLAGTFRQVVIIDRDRLDDTLEFRRGTPQSQHAHTLLPQGQVILEELFPGISAELIAKGAVSIDPGHDIAFFQNGSWRKPRPQARLTVSSSRPLLESVLFDRVSNLENVNIISNHEVTSVRIEPNSNLATGVNIRRRGGFPYESVLPANLIVDSSGRSSAAPKWLSSQGYPAPDETIVDAHAGYSSRIYALPMHTSRSWKTLYVRPFAPSQGRGGVILPLEGNRWHVALMGMAGDFPPTDPEGFLNFARSLPVPDFYAAIRDARPLTNVIGFRRTATRMLHFDRTSCQPANVLFLGDSAYILNPVYAMGMTAAAIGGLALKKTLAHQYVGEKGNISNLAIGFQRKLSSDLARSLQLVINEDLRWPETQVTINGKPVNHYSNQQVLQLA